MVRFRLGLMATSLVLPHVAMAAIRRDLAHNNIPVAEMDGKYTVDHDSQEILFTDNDNNGQHSDFEEVFRCARRTGKQLTFNRDETFVACCAHGQYLLGSARTAFDCCGGGHYLAGSNSAGYSCCPTGQIYDGDRCREPDPVCKNGKNLVNGRCECPGGLIEDRAGGCKRREEPRSNCDSGLREGKCYTFRMENGELLGYDNNGYYTAAADSSSHVFGKFKLCKTERCDGASAADDGTTAAINPGDAFRILDVHGQANSGGRANEYLDNVVNGWHIGKTALWDDAGEFAITKWTCGRYCLSGHEYGLGPTCPSMAPALTFNTLDREACRPLEVVEVPCEVRDPRNNCLWGKGGCGPGDAHCKCN